VASNAQKSDFQNLQAQVAALAGNYASSTKGAGVESADSIISNKK